MRTRTRAAWIAALLLIATGTAVAQQYPLLDTIAETVIQKVQSSSCEQLWQDRAKPKGQREQELVQLMKTDPQARKIFLDKVAAPLANKMFECGLFP